MGDLQAIQSVTKFCTDNLDMEAAELGDEYFKASMPLCVVDSVFSIGVRYEGVTKAIQRLCQYYNISPRAKDKLRVPGLDEQLSTSDFLRMFGDMTPQQLANEVFKNKQRTSTRNGILKAEAVIRFLKVLKAFNAEYFQDVPGLINNETFELCIKAIPGQRSGISLKYFFMLAGTDDIIKPDRMIIRFLQVATGRKFNIAQCQALLYAAVNELNKEGHALTPRLLDNVIWNYQRAASKKSKAAKLCV